MTDPKHTKLASRYANLRGASLLEAIADDPRDAAILEAVWRLGEPITASQVVGPMLKTEAPHLVELVLDEILAPTLDNPLRTQVVTALGERRPALPKGRAIELAQRLRNLEPLHGYYEPYRNLFEMWALEQDGKVGEDFAIDVISGTTPQAANGTVRESAYQRCRSSERVMNAAGEALTAKLGDTLSQQSWTDAVEFIEQACRNTTPTPKAALPVLRRLVELASRFGEQEPFPPEFERLVVIDALAELESALGGGPLPETPGSRSLVRLIATVPRAPKRAGLFALVARQQPQFRNVLLQPADGWDENEWRRMLKALVGKGPIDRAILSYLFERTPATVSAAMIELTLDQVTGDDDQLLSAASQRLRARLDGVVTNERDEWIEAVYWPRRIREDEFRRFERIFEELSVGMHTRLMLYGFADEKLSATTAAQLLGSQATDALRLLTAGAKRQELALAVAEHRPELLDAAVASAHEREYADDLVRALAPEHPEAAFAGAGERFVTLPSAQKDELVALLGEHATAEQMPLLEAIVADDHVENTDRRVAATTRIATLAVAGADLPQSVVDLLKSSRPKLREAAVEAIEQVKPRDVTLIASLHAVAAGGSAPGKAAARALDTLADEFLADLKQARASKDKGAVNQLIPLLGAVGRARVFRPISAYLGAEGVYDDPPLHQVAAAALLQASEFVNEVSEDDQAALVELLEGDDREVDPQAREALSSALARIQLGQDAALQVLYSELKAPPKAGPDALFGHEKERLVRHLGLYARARDQGESGWGLTITQLDNVAEGLVRAAYLAVGESEPIKQQIRNDPREPDYGSLITALSSVGKLNSIQGDCRVLRDLRSSHSEVPHAGNQPDADVIATARQCFKKIASVTVGTLDFARRPAKT